ncbi:hypothetical protein DH2020_047433 [Rehmannia glutinosa]|uniref:GDSL esterase/lipase n=1 Tax=Rehmannia glutinosa TaxID=99300 RepID=A0ABR0U8K0_REHGL
MWYRLSFCKVWYHIAEAVIKLPQNSTIPAVIVFGDSVVDTGNNNYIETIVKVNYPPYGKDFMGGKPTGRFSDGKVPSDLIAEELGIKGLLAAYFDPTLQDEDLLTGVNFASGGAGYDPLTSDLVDLYKLGARRIGVFGLPPGCLPSQRTLKGGAERKCIDLYNQVSELFNNKLSDEMDSINKRYPIARMTYMDIYKLPLDVIHNPQKYEFRGWKADRRFSDGKVPSDLLAEELGIKPLLPAYLDPSLQDQDFLTGVNFASGASGYDPLTSDVASVLSLTDQLKLFKEYITKLKKIAGEEKSSEILREGLIALVTGSNDITNTYFITPFRKIQYNVPSYTDLLVSYASSFVQESRLQMKDAVEQGQ